MNDPIKEFIRQQISSEFLYEIATPDLLLRIEHRIHELLPKSSGNVYNVEVNFDFNTHQLFFDIITENEKV